MNTKIFLIALSLLALSSCDLIRGGGNGNIDITDPTVLNHGTRGLVLSFGQNAPQSNYLVPKEGASATIIVNALNDGTHELMNSDAYMIINTDHSFVTVTPESQPVVLGGRTQTINTGGKNLYSFQARILPLDVNEVNTVIDATVCYRYSSTAIIKDMCIDPDPSNIFGAPKSCTSKPGADLKGISGGQGGPVGITNVEVVPVQDGGTTTPQLLITVNNLGSGKVYDSLGTQPEQLCNGRAINDNAVSNVYVLVTVGGQEFKCSPQPLQILNNAVSQTICKSQSYQFPTKTPTFTTTAQITLAYNYVDKISKTITLTRLEK